MRFAPVFVALACLAGCASTPRVGEPARSRALGYERRAAGLDRSGDTQGALQLATRALVVRIAACGYDCPEVAYSFTQLGDLRLSAGQPGHAAQSYARALEVLEPHRATHAAWIAALSTRLRVACAREGRAPPACRGGR